MFQADNDLLEYTGTDSLVESISCRSPYPDSLAMCKLKRVFSHDGTQQRSDRTKEFGLFEGG